MKKIVTLILLLALTLGLVSCGAGSSIAGEYKMTPGILSINYYFDLSGSDIFILASDGTGSMSTPDGQYSIQFDWVMENGRLLLKNFGNRTLLCDITTGKEFSTMKINDPDLADVEFVLEKTGDAPKSANTKEPDKTPDSGSKDPAPIAPGKKLYIGRFTDGENNYTFYESGVLRIEPINDLVNGYQMPYTVSDNVISFKKSQMILKADSPAAASTDYVSRFEASELSIVFLDELPFMENQALSRIESPKDLSKEPYTYTDKLYGVYDYWPYTVDINQYDTDTINNMLKDIQSSGDILPIVEICTSTEKNQYDLKERSIREYGYVFDYYGAKLQNGVLIRVLSDTRSVVLFDSNNVFEYDTDVESILRGLKADVAEYRRDPANFASNRGSSGQGSGQTPTTVIGYAGILINDLNIRTAPNTSAKIKGLAEQYKVYEVYAKKTSGEYTWYQIGDEAWIADDGFWVIFSTNKAEATPAAYKQKSFSGQDAEVIAAVKKHLSSNSGWNNWYKEHDPSKFSPSGGGWDWSVDQTETDKWEGYIYQFGGDSAAGIYGFTVRLINGEYNVTDEYSSYW